MIQGISEDDACKEEQRLIQELNATDRRYGYNQKLGGQVGALCTKEVCVKISIGLKAFYENNPQARKEISKRVTGYKHSEETKEKLREVFKGRRYVLTPEWKKHIGDSNKARLLSDSELYKETVERCRNNGMKNAKAVVQLNLDGSFVAKYSSAHEAERNTGIRNGNIGACCAGKAKTAGGYKWQYANEYNNSRETV